MAASPPALRTRRNPTKNQAPCLLLERDLRAAGRGVVVGVDEIGRGGPRAWGHTWIHCLSWIFMEHLPWVVPAAAAPADLGLDLLRDQEDT